MDEIKIIMSDLDGTLLNSDGKVTPRTIDAIKKAKEKGILFGLATGRPIKSCEYLMSNWNAENLVDIIVGLNGAHIKNYNLDKETTTHQLEGSYIQEIINHFKDLEVNFSVYYDNYIVAYKDDELVRRLSNSDNIPLKIMDFNELLKKPQSKLVILCKEDYMPIVQERCNSFSSPNYRGFQTGDILFEYLNPYISKSEGLSTVMQSYGLTMKNLLAFGDANNDFEMIRDSGVGVVMSNGSELTKAQANYITDDNNHDGVATFIEKYLL